MICSKQFVLCLPRNTSTVCFIPSKSGHPMQYCVLELDNETIILIDPPEEDQSKASPDTLVRKSSIHITRTYPTFTHCGLPAPYDCMVI